MLAIFGSVLRVCTGVGIEKVVMYDFTILNFMHGIYHDVFVC